MLQIQVLGWPDRVDQHLPVPLRLRRRTDQTLLGPGRYGGQGEGLPCLERLDSDSEVWHPGPPSGASASPLDPSGGGTGPDCGMEVAGGYAWVQVLGFFLTEVFCATHSGGGDPPARVVRVDQERPASTVACAVPRGVWSPEASPGTHAFSFSKS